MNKVTKRNVDQLVRWLKIQTKAYKERNIFFKNIGVEIRCLSYVDGIHVDDIRKLAHILNIPESKLHCEILSLPDYKYEYSFLYNGVKIFSVYEEVI